jgi:hypothetical protein
MRSTACVFARGRESPVTPSPPPATLVIRLPLLEGGRETDGSGALLQRLDTAGWSPQLRAAAAVLLDAPVARISLEAIVSGDAGARHPDQPGGRAARAGEGRAR